MGFARFVDRLRLGRFERRILVAIVLVVVFSLFGALGFGYVVVHDAFRMGVNDEVRDALREGVVARRAHLVTLRELTERTADWLAHDARLIAAIDAGDRDAARSVVASALASHSSIGRVAVLVGEEDDPFVEVERARPAEPVRDLSRTRPIPASTDAEVEVVLFEPERTFTGFQRAGETAEFLSRLEARGDYVSNVYVAVYTGVVLVISFCSMIAGLVLSRRVTRHLRTLTEATRAVGRGELDVQIPIRSVDEIGDLTHAFNTMVRDLATSRSRIEALQRIGAWQDFARRLAHEIKNPLTPIQLAGQELASSYRGDDPAFRKKLDDARSIIEEEVATLRRLVAEFSNFARLPVARLERGDVLDVVREIERSIPAMLEDVIPNGTRRPSVEFELPDSPLPARLDAMMFRRALDNVVRNAVQAVASHSSGSRVRVRVTRVDHEAEIRVDDDGPGIAAADRDRVFDPYFTTKSEGTGLGLPIVMKVVFEHGGSIGIVDGELGGACIRLLVPLDAD